MINAQISRKIVGNFLLGIEDKIMEDVVHFSIVNIIESFFGLCFLPKVNIFLTFL